MLEIKYNCQNLRKERCPNNNGKHASKIKLAQGSGWGVFPEISAYKQRHRNH